MAAYLKKPVAVIQAKCNAILNTNVTLLQRVDSCKVYTFKYECGSLNYN